MHVLTSRDRAAARQEGARSTGALRLGLAVAALGMLASCAYYNTFYLARKYYYRATNGAPYSVDGRPPAHRRTSASRSTTRRS
jgi:hypothetical protein